MWHWRRFIRVPWMARRSNQSILKELNPSIFIGTTDAEAEAPIIRPVDVKSWLTGRDPDAGKDWGQKRMTEDETVGWHEFEHTPTDCEGQGSPLCCSPWGHKQSDMTEWLNNNSNVLVKAWRAKPTRCCCQHVTGHKQAPAGKAQGVTEWGTQQLTHVVQEECPSGAREVNAHPLGADGQPEGQEETWVSSVTGNSHLWACFSICRTRCADQLIAEVSFTSIIHRIWNLVQDQVQKVPLFFFLFSVQFSSVAHSCPTLFDPMNHSTPGLPVHHQLPEFTQTHVHQVSDAIQPSHPLSSPSPAPNPSQHQSLL